MSLNIPRFLCPAILLLITMSASSGRVLRNDINPGMPRKLIFETTPIQKTGNMFKEYVLNSQPLTLKKYNTKAPSRGSMKESKIFYIPIKPMPYRHIPGYGYEYQPMKINPVAAAAQQHPVGAFSNYISNFAANVAPLGAHPTIVKRPPKIEKRLNSKIYRLTGHHYYFNGKPTKISTLAPRHRTAHAHALVKNSYKANMFNKLF